MPPSSHQFTRLDMTISNACYQNAAQAAKDLAERGIYLDVPSASVLGELLDASASFASPKTTELPMVMAGAGAVSKNWSTSIECRANDVAYITGNFEELSMHSKKVSDLVDQIGPAVSSHVSFARNTVKPIVLEIAGKLENYLRAAKPIDPTSQFVIIEGKVPAILGDESFMANGLENYVNFESSYPKNNLRIIFPETEEGFAEFTQLGNDRLNQLLSEWVRDLDPGFIRNVAVMNFTSGSPGVDGDYWFGSTSVGVYSRLNAALAGYIVASRLMSTVLKTENNMTLVEYKNTVRDWIDYCGAEVMKSLSLIRRQIEGNTMVTQVILSKKQITVHQVLYRAWLQAGGKPEVLLGMISSGNVLYSVSAIEESREKLMSAWNVYVSLVQADIRAETHRRLKDYVLWEMAASVQTLLDSEVEYAQGETLRTRIMENVKAEVEHLGHRLTDDLYHTALHLVAKARFYYTSSYEILGEMAKAAKARAESGAAADDELDAREAALLSAIRYLGVYCASMVKAVK